MADDELRAKDLIRKGEIAVRPYLGRRTTNILLGRAYWRPCGNSARIWKKMGTDDPFQAPEEFPRSLHRAVYAAGRFVRIDQAERAREKAKPKGPPAKPKPTEESKPQPKLPPALTQTPDPNRQPLFQPRKATQQAPSAAQRPAQHQPTDRQGARLDNPGPAVSSSGRLRTPMATTGPRRPQVVEDAAPPPIVANNAATEYAKAMASARAAQRPSGGDQEARQREIAERQAATRNVMSRGQGHVEEERPKHGKQRWIDHEAKLRQRAAAKAAAEKAASQASSSFGAAGGGGGKATALSPKATVIPPKAAPAVARAEQAKANSVTAPPALQSVPPRAPPPERPPARALDPQPQKPGPVAAAPVASATAAKAAGPVALTKGAQLAEGTVLSTPMPAMAPPPGGGQILNQMGPAAVVPRRKATVVETVEEDPATLQPKAPPADRSPPRPGLGGGMDDLFGGSAQEGRLRLPSRKKPT